MSPSFRITRILFPTDFSESSKAAAVFTAGLARTTQSTVHLLHVVPCLSPWHGASEAYFDSCERPEITRCEPNEYVRPGKALESLQTDYFHASPVELCIKRGGVAESIVEYADEIGADLISLPTQGWGPIRRFLIGSTTAKVLRDSRRPVLTSAHPRELGIFRPYRHVLCALDYQTPSRELLFRAAHMARLVQSRLVIVTAIPDGTAAELDSSVHKSRHQLRCEVIDVLKTFAKGMGVHADIEVLEGAVGEVIRQEAVDDNSGLIVIGHGHLNQPMGHLRTHAYEIIWNAPCAVLVV